MDENPKEKTYLGYPQPATTQGTSTSRTFTSIVVLMIDSHYEGSITLVKSALPNAATAQAPLLLWSQTRCSKYTTDNEPPAEARFMKVQSVVIGNDDKVTVGDDVIATDADGKVLKLFSSKLGDFTKPVD